jgi:hypothetical protein
LNAQQKTPRTLWQPTPRGYSGDATQRGAARKLSPQARGPSQFFGSREFVYPARDEFSRLGSNGRTHSRRILHCNATQYPTADWTIQQLREAIPSDHEYRFLIHDRHATFSAELDIAVNTLGLQVLKTPVRTPQANAFCERLIGTIRRECLDFMIPLNDRHLRRILREWVAHYN